jgi:sugar (pentulose or hexulose) kinase
MDRGLVAVFDVGKTNAKVVLASSDTGEVLWSRSRPTPGGGPEPFRHFDVEALEAFLLTGLADAPRKESIGSIVPVTHGACAVLVAEDEPVLPVLDYEETRIGEISAAYDRERDAFEATLSPALPLGLNLGRQLFWLKHRFPEAFSRATALLSYPQYWSWRLSGTMASEVTSLGVHTDLWSPPAGIPSALARRHGFAALLPPVKAASDVVGTITADVAARTGLHPSTRVVCGIHDSNASYIRHRLGRPSDQPFTVVSTGTWTIVMANGADLSRLDEARDMLANVNALGEPVATARFMGGREYEAILAGPGDALPGIADLRAVIDKGAMALPSFASAGGPFRGARAPSEAAKGSPPASGPPWRAFISRS